jgi:glycosyltransferase involved in cell wall biosynthesis
MRVVLNVIPVNSGGGQQQALNLLSFLTRNHKYRENWLILVGDGSVLHQWLINDSSLRFAVFKTGYINRFFLDYISIRKTIRLFEPNIVFHFTTAWRGVAIPQVVRTVYSNLYFPEINFWNKKPRITYWKKILIDKVRLFGTLRADGLIFENKAMLERSASLFDFPPSRAVYIRPSRVSRPATQDSHIFDASADFRVLYLSSWYRNKNIDILPLVALRLMNDDVIVKFVLTVDKSNSEVSQLIVKKSEELNVAHMFELLGTVHPSDVPALIESVDSMILLSTLECFSSNVVEAWSFGKPLIISKREWALSECSDAALYVEPTDPDEIAAAITQLVRNFGICDQLVSRGYQILGNFNTPDSKAIEQIAFLEYICSVGKKS